MEEKNKSRVSLKPDVIMKDYLRSNEKFADLINGVCFHGKQVVCPEELVDEDTDQSYLTKRGMAPAVSKRCWTFRKKCGIW